METTWYGVIDQSPSFQAVLILNMNLYELAHLLYAIEMMYKFLLLFLGSPNLTSRGPI